MSWFSDNYEKVALGGAAAVAVGLGVLVFNGKGAVEDAFAADSVKRNTDISVPGLERITSVKESIGETHEVTQYDVDGRKVDLLTGVPLFARRDDPRNPVDLLKSDPVHPGIDNTWWVKNKLEPGFGDSPERDPDKDGFSNREEYDAGTDPTKFGSHPDPVVKLQVVKVKTTQVHVKPQNFGNKGRQSLFKVETKGGKRLNRMEPQPITVGDPIVFIDKFMQKRFKFAGLDERRNPNGIVDVIWVIEDLKPNKLGVTYRFDRRGDLDGDPARKRGVMDSTVELILRALEQAGSPFKLEENTRFSLPFNEKAAQKPYLLKKVDLTNKIVEVEYTAKDGTKKIHPISYK